MLPLSLFLALSVAAPAPQDATVERVTIRETWPDGTLRVEAEAVHGADGRPVLDGKYASFHPDGTRESAGQYRAGQRHGAWRFLYPGGAQKRAEGSYKRGWREGAWKTWGPDGKFDPEESGTYATLTAEYPGGRPSAVGETLDRVPHGRWELYWPSGERMASGDLRRGRPVGTWLHWHADGSFDPDWISGVYVEGRRVGSVPAAETPSAPAADPSRVPALSAGGDLPPGVIEAIRARVDVMRVSLARGGALPATWEDDFAFLLAHGRAADALLLAPLFESDLADAEQARGAQLWERAVLARIAGSGFGIRSSAAPADQAWNRSCILRWHSFLTLARLDPWLLEIEALYAPVAADDVAHDRMFEFMAYSRLGRLSPALPIPGLDSDAARAAMHPLEAPRLTSNRKGTGPWGRDGERALDAALDWLVAHQAPDGHWSASDFMHQNALGRGCACDGIGQDFHDVGVTGLALLALMGDGSSPRFGRHATSVRRGLRFLLDQQDRERGTFGSTEVPGYIYDQAIATLALSEAAALCDSPALRHAAQAAVVVCCRARNPYSAWRYFLRPNNENDTSVTGWMFVALKAAQAGGLEIDPDAFRGALSWVDSVTDPATGRVGYDSMGSVSGRIERVNDHFPPEKGEAMTAVGLLLRLLAGQDQAQQPMLARHADLLAAKLPEWDPAGLGCDMYYWYYGTQAMVLLPGNKRWEPWRKAMKAAVLDSQRKDGDFLGSWDPVGPWGFAGGRVYSTALLAMSLEAPFRYRLPLPGN